MEKAKADYEEVEGWDVNERREEMKRVVVASAKEYVKAKKEKSRDQIH